MDEKRRTDASKHLSYVLRHQPASVGIVLEPGGWVAVNVLLAACAQHGRPLTRAELDELVATNSKQRFAFSDDGQRIRANQGHSTSVELGYQPAEPPEFLFHGTVATALPAIRADGLLRMQRHHVHLAPDKATARLVGSRRGKPIILRIDARTMRHAGYEFFVTPNNVWLTASVPASFISSWDDA